MSSASKHIKINHEFQTSKAKRSKKRGVNRTNRKDLRSLVTGEPSQRTVKQQEIANAKSKTETVSVGINEKPPVNIKAKDLSEITNMMEIDSLKVHYDQTNGKTILSYKPSEQQQEDNIYKAIIKKWDLILKEFLVPYGKENPAFRKLLFEILKFLKEEETPNDLTN